MSTESTSFDCAIRSKQSAKFYCTTCRKLLCLDCRADHIAKKCNFDSCDLIENAMMKELLKETDNQSINLEISQIMKSSTARMKNLFKWVEKEAASRLCECQKKVFTNMLTNEIKQMVVKPKNEQNHRELHMMCMNTMEHRNKEETKEKVNNNAEIIKEYQDEMQIILNEFCKRFSEINCIMNQKQIFKQQEPSQIVPKKPNPQPQVKPAPMLEPRGKFYSILELLIK